MTAQQALTVLSNATSQIQANRQAHQQIQVALNVLMTEIKKVPAVTEVKKEKTK